MPSPDHLAVDEFPTTSGVEQDLSISILHRSLIDYVASIIRHRQSKNAAFLQDSIDFIDDWQDLFLFDMLKHIFGLENVNASIA